MKRFDAFNERERATICLGLCAAIILDMTFGMSRNGTDRAKLILEVIALFDEAGDSFDGVPPIDPELVKEMRRVANAGQN